MTEVQVVGRAGVSARSTTVSLNVTVTAPRARASSPSFRAARHVPTASNLNYTPGATVANLVMAKIGAGGQGVHLHVAGRPPDRRRDRFLPGHHHLRVAEPGAPTESAPALTTIDGLHNDIGYVPGGTVTMVKVTGRGGVPDGAAPS